MEDLIPDSKKRTEVLTRLYKGDPILGDGGIFTDMLQAFVNAALKGEMDHHLQEQTEGSENNRRNGHIHKIVRNSVGPFEVHTPRDRTGDHEPILVKKWERAGYRLDDIILILYARGRYARGRLNMSVNYAQEP
jgi:transposase-like protein